METPPLEVTRAAGDLRALIGRLSRRMRQTSVVGEMTLSQASVLSLLERVSSSPSQRQDSRLSVVHDGSGKSDLLVPLPTTSLPKSNRCLLQRCRFWNAWPG